MDVVIILLIGFVLEGFVMVLLVIMICYCFVLDCCFSVLRNGRDEL